MNCKLCNNKSLELFHKGVRDMEQGNINVMKCNKCGLLQLSSFEHINDQYYQQENMHLNQYDATTDTYKEQTWESWIAETYPDDKRRFEALKELCKNKDVLDFGCGNGGFLRKLLGGGEEGKRVKNAAGVELDNFAREKLERKNITVFQNLEEVNGTWDVITMFQVLEHLVHPKAILNTMYHILRNNGLLIIETPNAEDALISLYNNIAFQNFTFWSAHVILYNTENLEVLLNSQGFQTVKNGQIQRYPLSNHLYWLSMAHPGGHKKWDYFNDFELNKKYAETLAHIKKCDTLFSIFRKE